MTKAEKTIKNVIKNSFFLKPLVNILSHNHSKHITETESAKKRKKRNSQPLLEKLSRTKEAPNKYKKAFPAAIK